MITITDDRVEARFPWPTNDVAGGVLKMMGQQANAALAAEQPDLQVPGGMRYTDLTRTDSGWEYLFTGTVKVPPAPEEA
jgi:hypothetical protein